jgi:molybdopterin converting factor small subunit
MLISVKFIGLASLFAGRNTQSLEVPAGSTIQHLLADIQGEKSSSSEALLRKATFLVNQVHADENTTLNDGDEVIIMAVLGGG